jgi:hypothetical protein
VKLKMSGQSDIGATNVVVENHENITCDIDIPFGAVLGDWDVEVTNPTGKVSTGGEGYLNIHEAIPSNPQEITPPWLNYRPMDISIDGDYACVTSEGPTGLYIYDINPPGDAWEVKSLNIGGTSFDVDVEGGYAYCAAGSHGFYIVDIDPPEDASVVKILPTTGQANRVLYNDGYVYLIDPCDYEGELYVIDVDPVEDTYLLSWVEVIGEPYMGGMAIRDNILYLAGHEAGLHVIQLW